MQILYFVHYIMCSDYERFTFDGRDIRTSENFLHQRTVSLFRDFSYVRQALSDTQSLNAKFKKYIKV